MALLFWRAFFHNKKPKLYKNHPTPKLYKTLQQQITPGYAKHRFSVISGTKTVKITPKNNP